MRTRLASRLGPGERVEAAFLASDFETSSIDGGSTRIIAVTDTHLVVIRAGLLRRTRPVAVIRRRPLSDLANPFFAWPGKTLYGEDLAEVLPGLWVHRRYRQAVVAAYGIAVRAAS